MKTNDKELDEERSLLNDLEKRNIRAFMRLYRDYNEDLLIFVYSRLPDRKAAIKMVEEFFEDLWLSARFTEIDPPIYRYLLKQITTVCEQRFNYRQG
ncbi:MAG: hypothetical protein JST68_11875 [Bacteroidetes bacterium]|nr:hypothetical protein [Bacteroidota bacterium]